MKKPLSVVAGMLSFLALLLPLASSLAAEEQEWKALKRQEKREQIDERADENLAALLETSPKLADRVDQNRGEAPGTTGRCWTRRTCRRTRSYR